MTCRRLIAAVVGTVLAGVVLSAASPAFDAATIEPTGINHDARSAAFGFDGTFKAVNASLYMLIVTAYGGVWPPEEIPALQVMNGPEWIGLEGFNVDAHAPANTLRSRMQEMLKTLLAERFALQAHQEARQMQWYGLDYARKDHKLGPELRSSIGPCVNTPAAAPPDPTGLPKCAERFGPSRLHDRRLSLVGMTMDQFAANLSGLNFVGGPVFNQTDLQGIFDIDVEFNNGMNTSAASFGGARDRDAGAPDLASGLSIFDAIRDELGLTLHPLKKGLVDVVVVDRAEQLRMK